MDTPTTARHDRPQPSTPFRSRPARLALLLALTTGAAPAPPAVRAQGAPLASGTLHTPLAPLAPRAPRAVAPARSNAWTVSQPAAARRRRSVVPAIPAVLAHARPALPGMSSLATGPRRPVPAIARALLLAANVAARLAGVRPQAAMTLTVTSNADSSSCPDQSGLSLRCAIAAAQPGDTVTFSPTVGPITLTAGQLQITQTLTIQGPASGSQVVDGSGNNNGNPYGGLPVFEVGQSGVATPTVTLSGLTIQHGRTGILVDPGATLTVSDSIVTGNGGGNGGAGGGIYANTGSTLALTTTSVLGNTANGNGGGLYASGRTVTMAGSTVSGNTANRNGGGLYVYPDQSSLLALTTSAVLGNVASGNGGGLYNGDVAVLGNDTFGANSAVTGTTGGAGGGIASTGALSLTNLTLSGTAALTNTIAAGNDQGSSVPANTADLSGTITSGGANLVGSAPGAGYTAGAGDQSRAINWARTPGCNRWPPMADRP